MSTTPQQEVADTVAKLAPRLAVAAHAVGLEDHRRLLSDYAQRVRDGHKAMANAAGMGDTVTELPRDDMGNLVVTGDINVGGGDASSVQKILEALNNQQSKPTATTQPATAAGAATGMSNLAKVVTAAGLLLGGSGLGAGTTYLLSTLNKPAQVINQLANPIQPIPSFDLEIQK